MGLKAGDWVEIRSREEILTTLDAQGSLEGMPFMPEMLRHCGRRLQVFKRAHKTCDTAEKTGGRSVPDTVHLAGVRCDGSTHGGCQAGCMIFWKSAWLRRVEPPRDTPSQRVGGDGAVPDVVRRGAYYSGEGGPEDSIRWRCQANELFRASSPLPWWDMRQYVEDLVSRNIGPAALLRGASFSIFRRLIEIGIGYRILVGLYDGFARLVGISSFPLALGSQKPTPTLELGLQPGEWVRVKPWQEILATLDANNRNRGLFFDVEATKFCGRTFRVLSRVTRILDERTGEMLNFKNPCIVLEQVWCGGEMSKHRVFCPRAIYPYFREIWLERVLPPPTAVN
ncbi:MAG: hypothetical protein FJ197_09980 [Gammaproteobacteria bacterium]|nr:hypothetical protein [Gammaproteobacteria bacterium]